MSKVSLTFRELLGFVILGLKNGHYDAALKLAEEYYDTLPDEGKPGTDDDG